MATIEEESPIVLRTDAINTELIQLLGKEYTVVIEKKGNDIIMELYNK